MYLRTATDYLRDKIKATDHTGPRRHKSQPENHHGRARRHRIQPKPPHKRPKTVHFPGEDFHEENIMKSTWASSWRFHAHANDVPEVNSPRNHWATWQCGARHWRTPAICIR
ncbi:hypothetical protein DER46DRAFT_270956 [Fusarium sp. MPI-SDFR-AT-0072]|nr:hypothetical protein DER46DRAFT_270956 [Fusarium sp. MPI-SDFR-AT-0072]